MRRLPGKPQPVRVVLGKYPSLSLAAARKQAGVALADLAGGIHPRERARALQTAEDQRKAVTVATWSRNSLPGICPGSAPAMPSGNCSAANWSAGGETGPSPTSTALT